MSSPGFSSVLLWNERERREERDRGKERRREEKRESEIFDVLSSSYKDTGSIRLESHIYDLTQTQLPHKDSISKYSLGP